MNNKQIINSGFYNPVYAQHVKSDKLLLKRDGLDADKK